MKSAWVPLFLTPDSDSAHRVSSESQHGKCEVKDLFFDKATQLMEVEGGLETNRQTEE